MADTDLIAAILVLLAACGDNSSPPDASPVAIDASPLPSCAALGCPGSSGCFSPTVCFCDGQRCEP